MIQQQYKNNVQDVSGQVQTTGFSIEINESMFQMLTANVYNDPTLAVIREWSTNACDACIAAGKEVKFDVHLPTLEEPNFSVRDYGTGLAPEDIVGLFSKLGASTKRGSNAYNGTFGIGRMAGLAVSNAFTVESYYNGVYHSYAISMQNGVPVTLHMGDMPSTAPNGLRLTVSVEYGDIPNYIKKAEYLYKYFDHKPTLNLDTLDIHLKVEEHISDDWFIQAPENQFVYTNYVVMSQVPYAIPDNHVVNNQGFKNLVIKAPPGAVSFNPGRESLSLNKETVEYLNTAFKKIADDYVAAATAAMASAVDDFDLMKVYKSLTNTAPGQVAEKIDPTPFASKCYQNLFASPRWRNTAATYQYVSTTDDFSTDVSKTLYLAHKSNYYKTSKPVLGDNPLSWTEFFYASHVIVDMKTKFRSALNEAYSGKSLITWQRREDADFDDALNHAKRYLDTMGIPYKLASELVSTEEVKVSAPREGLYVSPLVRGKIRKAEKMEEDQVTNGTYLYIKMTHTTPDLPESAKASFEGYTEAYAMLARAGIDVPPVRGVAKKYQSYVTKLDNWLDFYTYIEEKMAEATFKAPLAELPVRFQYSIIDRSTKGFFPKDIEACYNEWINYNNYNSCGTYLSHPEHQATAEAFGATVISHTWDENVDIVALKNKYRDSFPIITGNLYMPRADTRFVARLAKLEDFYATHSSQ